MQDLKQQAVEIFKRWSSATTTKDKSLAFMQMIGLMKKAKAMNHKEDDKEDSVDKEGKKHESKEAQGKKKKELKLNIKCLPKMDLTSMAEEMMGNE